MSETKRKNEDINNTWVYKVIYEDKLYKVVEDFGKFGYAELGEEKETLHELEQMLVDDFFRKIKAIRTYQEDTNSEGK